MLIIWIILISYVIYKQVSQSKSRFPRPSNCTRKQYDTWRELVSAPLYVTIFAFALSIMTVFLRPKTFEEFLKYRLFNSILFFGCVFLIVLFVILGNIYRKKYGIFNEKESINKSNKNNITNQNSKVISSAICIDDNIDNVATSKIFTQIECTCPHCQSNLLVDMVNSTDLATCPNCNFSFGVHRPS